MSESIDSALLARFLSNECSDPERDQVEAWIREQPGRRRMMQRMAAVWETQDDQLETSDVGRLWQEVAHRAGISIAPEAPDPVDREIHLLPRRRTYRLLRYAAVLVGAIGLPYLATRAFHTWPEHQQAPALKTIAVETGRRARVTLDDGTAITLDAGSTLTYPEAPDGGIRVVTFEGEGYFEVAGDPQRPFVIHTHQATVRVLGTRFAVRAWERDRRVQVAVVEGEVSLRARGGDPGESVVIAAGQGSVLLDGGAPTQPQAVDVEAYLDWMRDELAYDDAPLGEVMHRLERWYGVRFALADTSVAGERVTVHIEKRSLEDALEMISALTGLACEHEGDVVRLAAR